jgi:DNA processing protein
MDSERLSFLALHRVPGIGGHLAKQLVSYCGSAEQVFKTPKGTLLKIPGVGKITADAIKSQNSYYEAEKELRKSEKEDVQILFFTDRQFPARLKAIEDAPALLYVKGNTNLNPPKVVGIVGTRQATGYGRHMVEKIVEGLVPHQALIVSGLAYGIDIQAHKQALKCDLPTLAVLGSGMDVIYPAAHQETARKMLDQGGLVTENPFGAKPDAHNFPARNRIIAGLCDALIVVEAAEKGGALITAEIANSYNKDVFAVPGNIGQPYSEGCNKLIKINKAHLLTSTKDLEYIMNWNWKGVSKKGSTLPLFDLDTLGPQERKVIQLLKEHKAGVVIDELSLRTEIPPSTLASVLLSLEFGGLVSSLPGKRYKLVIGDR